MGGVISLDEEVECAAIELKAIHRRSGLERALAVGQVVIDRFFGGDVQAWRDRRKNKNTSIRRLARHPACPFSRSALNQAVAISVLVKSSPEVTTFTHVGATHMAAVIHLPASEQLSCLKYAEREQLSVRQLKDRIRLLHGDQNSSVERNALKVVHADLQRFEMSVERLGEMAASLHSVEWDAVLQRLASLQTRVRHLASASSVTKAQARELGAA